MGQTKTIQISPVRGHSGYEEYHRRTQQAVAQMRELGKNGQLALEAKPDSHVFRTTFKNKHVLNLRHFTNVIHVNKEEDWVDVEGMISYHDLVESLAPLGLMPKIVPELRSITVGGSISGVGIEASSFRYGLVHETVREMDVLTGDGRLLTCTQDNTHKELFYGMPNSYGVLGYILRARVEIMSMKPYVRISHRRFSEPKQAFKILKEASDDHNNDFVEGVAFSKEDIRVLTGTLIDELPEEYVLRDLRIKNRFFESIRDGFSSIEYMPTIDFFWRWDADAYWATRDTILENKIVRGLLGTPLLRSDRMLRLLKLSGKKSANTLTQDIGIPYRSWTTYFDWYHKNLDKFPLWLCTTRARPTPLFRVTTDELYCDFGSFSAKFPDAASYKDILRKTEKKMLELGGIKCFYSDNALSEDDFYKIVDKKKYVRLKKKYDPSNAFPDLFKKCVAICDNEE